MEENTPDYLSNLNIEEWMEFDHYLHLVRKEDIAGFKGHKFSQESQYNI